MRIEEENLIVPNAAGEALPQSAKALEEHVSRRLPHVALPAVLLEVERWTHCSQRLAHAGGGHPRTEELLLNLYATLLAQGTNMGLTEMAHSTNLTFDRLAWTPTGYLREEPLKAVVTALVNCQYTQPLAHQWGGGTLSAAAGQRLPVRGKACNAVALPRYFGYGQGMTFSTWTRDQFAPYGAKVIATTVRAATYVLDDIRDNATDLARLEHTTDTAGYTDGVFALFALLGRQFSPRLRALGQQRLSKLQNDQTMYTRLEARLTGRVDPTRLLDRWAQLVRVAGSRNRGYGTASLLISKLQASPKSPDQTPPRVWEACQNDLYPAVLGRPRLASAGARPAQQRRGAAPTAEVAVLRPRWRRVAKICGRPQQPSGLFAYPDECGDCVEYRLHAGGFSSMTSGRISRARRGPYPFVASAVGAYPPLRQLSL